MRFPVFVLVVIVLAGTASAAMVARTITTPTVATNVTIIAAPLVVPTVTNLSRTIVVPANVTNTTTNSTLDWRQGTAVRHLDSQPALEPKNATPGVRDAGQMGEIYGAMSDLERQAQGEKERQQQEITAANEQKMHAAVAAVEQKEDEIAQAKDSAENGFVQQTVHGVAGFFSSLFGGKAEQPANITKLVVLPKAASEGFFSKLFSLFSKPPVLAASPPGPRSDGMHVDLAAWWQEVPQDTTIDFDPIGGILYLYWLDDQGTVCHGTPGPNGVIGPQVLNPEGWSELFTIKDQKTAVSEEELAQRQAQTYKMAGGSYVSNNYDANGPHIVNYGNLFYRIRADGTVFKNDVWRIALPQDVDLESDTIAPATTLPVATAGAYDPCYMSDEKDIPVPSTTQTVDSSKCQTRASITSADLIIACRAGKLQGGFAQGWFKIV